MKMPTSGLQPRRWLTRYVYAAALGKRPITDVYRWVNDEKDFTAETILREAGEGTVAQALEKDQMVTEKQRDGVYGQVRTWFAVLGNPKIAAPQPMCDLTIHAITLFLCDHLVLFQCLCDSAFAGFAENSRL